ncbi:MAG: 4-(cytidine 5'-diphospho)-2-C-methyl-D-erythritol kinase [Phycisphaerae bacterium]
MRNARHREPSAVLNRPTRRSAVSAELTIHPPLPLIEGDHDALVVRAPAKINLNLLVGSRRDDGYHPLDSIVAQVSLYDTLSLRLTDDGEVKLDCEGPDCGPADQNLALRAAELLAERCGAPGGVRIRLQKQIPPGAGLGGGSSDAAAVLKGLRRLWKLDISDEQLVELAAELGSDVPLFLGPPVCRMRGRGEIIEPLEAAAAWVLLILPGIHCSTRAVYEAFDHEPEIMAGQTEFADLLQPPSRWREDLQNQLGPAARRVSPTLANLWDALRTSLPVTPMLTGSGSALFCLCDHEKELQAVAAAVSVERLPLCCGVRMLSQDGPDAPGAG